MSNPITNWWQSCKFNSALKQGNELQTKQLLQKIESSGVKLSQLEQLLKKATV